MGKAAAFFDFDKTLLIKESAELGFKWAWENNETTLGYLLKVMFANQLHKRNLVSAERMAALCIGFYKGKNLVDYKAGASLFYQDWLKPHLSPAMLARVKQHRQAGDTLVILSASIRYLLQTVADDLGFDEVLCSELELGADGLLTGRTEGPICIGPQKRVAAQNLAESHGIDLAASTAYGDHHSDIPLLEAVGHPVVVRPTKWLKKVALERNWPIVEEG